MSAEPPTAKATDTITSTQFNLTRSQLSKKQQQRMDERLKEVASGVLNDNLKVGETKKAGSLGGTTLYVTLINEQNSNITGNGLASANGLTTSSQTFLFKYYNLFGVLADAFQVSLTCNWYKNGSNSYLINLTETYTVLDSSFSCAWDTASGSVAEKSYQALYMYAYHNGGSTWHIFDAVCNTLVDPPYVSFGHS